MKQLSNLDTCMNAYELAERVLAHPQGGVEALVRLASGQETDWLELKAGLGPPRGEPMEKGTNKCDYQWHVARAVIAMANTSGGVVILGLKEERGKPPEPIGLESCDPKGILADKGPDDFLRKCVVSAIRPVRGWKAEKAGHWHVSHGHGYLQNLTFEMGAFKNHKVVVVLVPPIPAGDRLLEVEQSEPFEREVILVRDQGHIGNVRLLHRSRDRNDYLSNREVSIAKYASLWEKFVKNVSEQAIKEYLHTNILKKPEMREARKIYVDLSFLPEKDEYADFETYVDTTDQVDRSNEHDYSDKNVPDSEKRQSEQKEEPVSSEPGLIAKRIFDSFSEGSKPLMVIGSGGSGKTTLLRYVAYKLAQSRLNNKSACCPVLLNLSTESSRPEEIGLDKRIANILGVDEKEVTRLMAEGAFVYLLDGFDEIPNTRREFLQNKISVLLDNLRKKWVVVSSRYRFDVKGYEKSFDEMRLQPLNDDQAIAIIARYLSSPKEGEGEARIFWKQIAEKEVIRAVALRPLMLRIIVRYMKGANVNFGSFGHFMRSFTKMALNTELTKNVTIDENERPLYLEEVHLKLSNIAFEMICQDNLYKELRDLIDPYDRKLDPHPVKCCMGARLGEKFKKGDKPCFRFKHETVRDYFAAEHLQEFPDAIKDLMKRHTRKSWEDQNYDLSIKKRVAPIVLATELSEHPSEVLRHPGFTTLIPELREAVLLETRIPAAVSALAAYCSLSGMPQNLITIMDERQVRKAAALSLSSINTEDARNALIKLSRSEDSITKLFATVALGKTQTCSNVVNELMRLISDPNARVAKKALIGLTEHKNPPIISRGLLRCYSFAMRESIECHSIFSEIEKRFGDQNRNSLTYLSKNEDLRRELLEVMERAQKFNMSYVRDLAFGLIGKFGPSVKPPQMINEQVNNEYFGTFSRDPWPGIVKCDSFSGPVPCLGCHKMVISDGEDVSFSVNRWDDSEPLSWVIGTIQRVVVDEKSQMILDYLEGILCDPNGPLVANKVKKLDRIIKPLSSLSVALIKSCIFAGQKRMQATCILFEIKNRLRNVSKESSPYLEANEDLLEEVKKLIKCADQSNNRYIKDLTFGLLRKYGPPVKPPLLITAEPDNEYYGKFYGDPWPGIIKCDNFSGPVPCVGYRVGGIFDGADVIFTVSVWGMDKSDCWVVNTMQMTANIERRSE